MSIRLKEAALIIVDMQNAFYSNDAIIKIDLKNSLIDNIISVIKYLRQFNFPIIWTRAHHENITNGEYKNLNPNHFDNKGEPIFTKKSNLYEIIPQLKQYVSTEDIFIDKEKYNAFYKTNLGNYLEKRQIKNLVFAGVTTNICIESTVREAFERDYNVIVLEDCVSSLSDELNNISLAIIKLVFGYVLNSKEFMKELIIE